MIILAQVTRLSTTITVNVTGCIRAGTDLHQVFTERFAHLKMFLGAAVVRLSAVLKTGQKKHCDCGAIN